jgi:hypothetical protein
VPHELTDDLREKRIAIGRQLLEVREEAQSTDFRGLVTGNESWFHLSYTSRAVWTISRDEVPTKEKQAVSTRKSERIADITSFQRMLSSSRPSSFTCDAYGSELKSIPWSEAAILTVRPNPFSGALS